MAQQLPFINKVSYALANALGNSTVVSGNCILIGDVPFAELQLVGLAKCEISSKVENKTRSFTTVLTAHICSSFDARQKALVFLLECVDGSRYLMGTAMQPYPKVTTTQTFPGSPNESTGCLLTAELTDSFGLLHVLG